jgi:hypothetical protein
MFLGLHRIGLYLPIYFLLLAWSQPTLSYQERSGCINDAEKYFKLARQVNSPQYYQNATFLNYWKFEQERVESCPPSSNTNLMSIATRFQGLPHISRDCIRSALLRVEKIDSNRIMCSSDGSRRIRYNYEDNSKKGRDWCIDESMVDYIHWSFNKTLECVNAIALHPLDPKIFFKKINNESSFAFHIANKGGMGIGQLTTFAMREMERSDTSSGGYQYIRRAMESEHPSCVMFRDILSKTSRPGQRITDRVCDFVSAGEGIARNLFYSMAYFVHKRDTHPGPVRAWAKKHGITNPRIIDLITLVGYSRHGAAAAKRWALQVIASGVDPNDYSSFEAKYARKAQYIKDINEKMREFLQNHTGKDDGFTPEELEGDICIGG